MHQKTTLSCFRHFLPGLLACVLTLSSGAYGQICLDDLASIEESRFEANGDGTLYDSDTGLFWTVCSYGQSWGRSGCSGTAVQIGLAEAFQVADSLYTGGYSDWRVPNINELQSLVDWSCYDPATSNDVFDGIETGHYWSSSVREIPSSSDAAAMVIDFYSGRAAHQLFNVARVIFVRQDESL
jgi:hypothetical protein